MQHPALVFKLSCALYDASEYACRMYDYEPSLPGTFSMPLLYGQGLRVNVQLNWKTTRRWNCLFQLTSTKSGLIGQTGDLSKVNSLPFHMDMATMIRWKF
jgi:hypothetical protein